MPAVTVLPTSPALRNFGPPATSAKMPYSPCTSASATTITNGAGSSRNELTVADIKEKVRTVVQSVRGASALSLLRTARDKVETGLTLEEKGDLRESFRALLTAAQLSQVVLEHQDFKQEVEQKKKGVVWKDFIEYQRQYGSVALAKAESLESKLLELEKAAKGTSSEVDDLAPKPGGSIADRMRSLQDAGLSVQTTKRFSRDLSIISPPIDRKSTANTISRASSSQDHTSTHAQIQSPTVTSHPTGSSVHSLVSPSPFNPPSPTSSTATSPHVSHLSFSEFNHTFPSIDELDEMGQSSMHAVLPELPSVPTNKPGTFATLPLASPSVIQRFPSLPLDLEPGPRSASTPVTPSVAAFQSRPASPSLANPLRSPLSPSIPPKPASLTMTGGSASSRTSPMRTSPVNTGESSRSRGLDLPVTNNISPRTLHEYLDHGNEVKVLLLDVRTRDEFARAHIKSDVVVCLEPHVLLRDGLTSDKLEDALSVAPQRESTLFRNRDKFDLVVMYDAGSENFGSSIAPMSVAVRVIYETAFRRVLKRPPVILVGGLKAWGMTFPDEVAQDDGARTLDFDLKPLELRSPSIVNGTAGAAANVHTSVNGRNESTPEDVRSPTAQPRYPYAMDQIPEDASSPRETNGVPSPEPTRRLVRKPTMSRPPSTSSLSYNIRGLYDNSPPYLNGSHAASSSSITYPQYPRPSSSFGTSLPSASGQGGIVSPPPTASINPSPLSRRRSDYIDQSEQAVSTFANRQSIDYPDLSAQHVVRPPPAAASPSTERKDNRRLSHGSRQSVSMQQDGPRPPIISSDYPVAYWPNTQIATSGLKNLGNTCYMNSTIQCLSATVPFSRFFTDGRWKNAVNMLNPLGSKGQLSFAFASILHALWHQELSVLSPHTFRRSICVYGKQFAGSEQHDSQEFLNFLLDGLHEDLNRILQKPPIKATPEREAELEVLPQQIASQQEWNLYRTREDSIVVDFFQGQFRNRMECQTCRKTSTTYNPFMYLTLPIPNLRGSKVTLQQCLDAFVQEEVMEKADAWQCPNCKTLRKATKRLSISRLPPVLLIHLKRFMTKGHFTDKLETFVDFPLKGLDMTNYMPPPLPPGIDRKSNTPISLDDPRSQIPPYRYDLYAVTNHFGTLSSGHCKCSTSLRLRKKLSRISCPDTAFINSRGSWQYCDDSRISSADAREVVGKPAYFLYYKRVKS
ncbi:cysteine proteinase [Phellopilus nigrolimitatus]|nr:cysteine proteinase [Phellopilus nigrolimitatus]